MHISFDRSQKDLPGAAGRQFVLGFFGFQDRHQPGNCFFHHPGAFDYLGQKHLPCTKEVAHLVHSVHQGSFNDLECLIIMHKGFVNILIDVVGDAFDQRVSQALVQRECPPLLLQDLSFLPVTMRICISDQTIGSIFSPVQDHILHQFQQILRDLVVDQEVSSVDDPHIQTGFDGMEKEGRMHGFPDKIVPPEREGKIADTAADTGIRKVFLDPFHGADEIHRIGVMFINPGGNREDIGIKNDIFGQETHFFGKDIVSPAGDHDTAFERGSLTLLIEGHHDHRGAHLFQKASMFPEFIRSFLQTDRVDDRFPLDAGERRNDHRPSGRVDHHRNFGNIRIGSQHVEEGGHRFFCIQHRFIHADIDDLGSVFHLLPGYRKGLFVILLPDQAGELY